MRLTPEQAIARLQPNLAPSKTGKTSVKPLELKEIIGEADEDLYVLGNENGNILTPAYDSIRPIIATWEEGNEIPPALKEWFSEYANEIEWWNNVGEELQVKTPTMLKAPAKPRQSTPMLMDTKWSQKAPYNDLLVFDGKKCVTGCNTTATAQIMYYWGKKGYHRGCKATKGYKTDTNQFDVPALPPLISFDYKNLVKSPKTDEQKAAVAKLMQYVGYSIESDYTPSSTGAYPKNVFNVMRDVLKLGSGITYIYASKGADKYEKAVYEEILAKRPVLLAGWKASGGGHTFVTDGYDADKDLYHINWGWGGSYDGWFAMSALNPTSARAYNSNKVAIVGIQPEYKLGDVNGDGEVNIADAMQAMTLVQQGKFSEAADINYDGQVTITDVQVIFNKILGKGMT